MKRVSRKSRQKAFDMLVVAPAAPDVATLARVGQLPCHLRRDFLEALPFLPSSHNTHPPTSRYRRIPDSPGPRSTISHLSEVTAKRRVTGSFDHLRSQAIAYFLQTHQKHIPSPQSFLRPSSEYLYELLRRVQQCSDNRSRPALRHPRHRTAASQTCRQSSVCRSGCGVGECLTLSDILGLQVSRCPSSTLMKASSRLLRQVSANPILKAGLAPSGPGGRVRRKQDQRVAGHVRCFSAGNTAASCVGLVRLPWEARVEVAGWTFALIKNGQR